MQGTGVPVVTPFDSDGRIVAEELRDVVSWLVDAGVDFLVPSGSNGESELMTLDERARVVELVADESPVPVLAGTGHPGFEETREQTARAAEAGADAALVVTPYYYTHDQATLERYYRRLADESTIPIYLYNVPGKARASLDPETVSALSMHENVHGIKDSSGDVVALQQELRRADDDFEVFIGNGSLYAQGLDVGTAGGVLALANVVPGLATEIYRRHREGDADGARALNGELVELNQAITARYGVPGVKAAMRVRDVPAGEPRSPFGQLDAAARREIEGLVTRALE